MCDTPSHGSDHLWLIWKESIQNCRCYRADTATGTDGRTDGQTDGQTDGVKPIYPPTTSLFGGYNKSLFTCPRNNCQAPAQLTIFRWNWKFNQNCSGLKCTLPITMKFCTCHDSVTVKMCAKFCWDWLSIFQTRALPIYFEFDRNIVSGTGASSHDTLSNLFWWHNAIFRKKYFYPWHEPKSEFQTHVSL